MFLKESYLLPSQYPSNFLLCLSSFIQAYGWGGVVILRPRGPKFLSKETLLFSVAKFQPLTFFKILKQFLALIINPLYTLASFLQKLAFSVEINKIQKEQRSNTQEVK